MACGQEFIVCAWWNEDNYLISVCLRQWVVGLVCSSIFSNTVMDIGTFARLGPQPFTYHLKERGGEKEGEMSRGGGCAGFT